jgi:hypothetical protein
VNRLPAVRLRIPASPSIGVVTFNGDQQRLIENQARRSDPSLEAHFDARQQRLGENAGAGTEAKHRRGVGCDLARDQVDVAIVLRWASRLSVEGVRFVPLVIKQAEDLKPLPLAAAWLRGARLFSLVYGCSINRCV